METIIDPDFVNKAKQDGTLWDGIEGLTIIQEGLEGKYEFPNDGTDFHCALIVESDDHWFVDLGLGMGFGGYEKTDWTIEKAIKDQIELFNE